MKHIIPFLISPMMIFSLLITLCLIQEIAIINTIPKGCRRRKPRWLILITIFWFFIISTKPVPHFLAGIFEKRYQVFDTAKYDIKDTIVYIVVLGAGNYSDPFLPANMRLGPASLGRLTEAVRIHKIIPNSFVVTYGQADESLPEDKGVFAQAAIAMGVNPGKILQIGKVKNTMSEAAEFSEKFGSGSEVIVVTDAMHMTRAILFFRTYELYPTPAPVNFTCRLSSGSGLSGWIPSTDNINTLTSVIHELGGLAYYHLVLSDYLN